MPNRRPARFYPIEWMERKIHLMEKYTKVIILKKKYKEIIEYAQSLHIQIIPEIEMPGHSSAVIAAYPEFGTTKNKLRFLVALEFSTRYWMFLPKK